MNTQTTPAAPESIQQAAPGQQPEAPASPAAASPAPASQPPVEHAYIPEKFRVIGQDGKLDLETSAQKLAQSYEHAVRRIGSGDVPPERPDGYQVKLPEQFADVELPPEAFEPFKERAHQAGLTPAQFEFVIGEYGPNPEAQMRLQFDLYEKTDGPAALVSIRPQTYWSILSGKTGMPENSEAARLAQIAQDARNIQTASKLGRAVVSSVTDLGTMVITTGYNKLGYWELLRSIRKQADPQTREFLSAHGIIADSLISDLNRWSGEHVMTNWSGRLANSTMKLSLMNLWTDRDRKSVV